MNLYDREFFRRLRSGVRREVKARPEWRKEARRVRRSKTQRHLGLPALRWAVWLGFLGLAMSRPAGHGLWLTLTAWALYLTLQRAAQFQRFCMGREGAAVFLGLPVTARQVFEVGISRGFRSSLWLLGDALVTLGLAVPLAEAPLAGWWGVLPAALLIWLSVLATAVVLLWRWPDAKFSGYGTLLMTLGVATGMAMGPGNLLTFAQLKTFFPVLAWGTPPGWACQLAMWLVGERLAFPVAPVGLLTFWIALAVPCYRAGIERFTFWEPETPPPASLPEEEPGSLPAKEFAAEEGAGTDDEPSVTSSTSECEERILRGTFLQPFANFRLGWVERLILPRLHRHAALLDFLLGAAPNWSSMYRFGCILLVAGSLLALLKSSGMTGLPMWMVGLSLFSALGSTTPLFGGNWPGFQLGPMGHRHIAVLALLPVGLREARRVILIVNGLRFALALPCWVAAALVMGHFSGRSLPDAVRMGVECWLAVLLLQPFFLVFKYSQGTNDTSSGFLTCLLFLVVGLFPLASAGSVLFAIFTPAPPVWQWAALFGLGIATFAFEAVYRWMYTGQRFDLLANARHDGVG